jgi:Rgg/GadR/MutR family transcriptional activator
MELGETLEFIRRNKNISLKTLCGTTLSRQNYYRIVHGQVNTSINTFKFILDQLHVNFDEFYFIKNNFRQDKIFADMNKVKIFFDKGDLKSLDKMIAKYLELKQINQSYLHMYCLINVLKHKLSNHASGPCEALLRDYLTNVETWTHYETVLFNNCMFIFSTEFIDVILSKSLHNLSMYSTLRKYGNESFRMLTNVLILFIEREEFERATFILNKLHQNRLTDDLLFEKACLEFFENAMLLVTGETTSDAECQRIINLFRELGSDGLAVIFERYLQKVRQ